MNILVTGCAGFIGFHFCNNLLKKFNKIKIFGVDNFNNYYDTNLKKNRVKHLKKKFKDRILINKIDLIERDKLDMIFKKNKICKVVNFAAQAGVRYSIQNPSKFIRSNIVGFQNIIDLAVKYKIDQLIYASSSSVYGGIKKKKLNESLNVNNPIQLYAATKISNEMIANAYNKLYGLQVVGLRFFTVYGPWGRPDMAPMIFTKSIFEGVPIRIFNNGDMIRDFTYIDDVVEAITKLINKPALGNINFNTNEPEPSTSWAPHRIFNIGNQEPIALMDFINTLEEEIGIKAKKTYEGFQKGDVKSTSASIHSLKEWVGYTPYTSIKKGIKDFVEWYKVYYNFI